MTRGFIMCTQNGRSSVTILSASIDRLSQRKFQSRDLHNLRHFLHPQSCSVPSIRCFREPSSSPDPIDLSNYREAFTRRMNMAGLNPNHRIALGVSGGPDSMALCVLTSWWKTAGLNASRSEDGAFINGLLAIIVDHGLRAESKEEANVVSHRVSAMGIRCEIAHCNWSDGRPKQGQVQEAAREMRYKIFYEVCVQHQIGILLIAHHADDQVELFILRLSRNSGVLGLAGMPFTSQNFPTQMHSSGVALDRAILLVRPLLDFSKKDMYKICQGANVEWVEDPTNRSPLYARNRIRSSLSEMSSSAFNSELQEVISACRKTRSYVEHVSHRLIDQAVIVMDHGYAVIDLQILNQSKIEDLCLSKFISSMLQFISQRHRPIRGGTSKLLLDYFNTIPCKTSLTAAGCYLCPAPGSRGSRALVCCSVNCPLPSRMELFQICSDVKLDRNVTKELGKIIEDGKSNSDLLLPDAPNVHFLDMAAESVLTEAKKLGILSESTCREILLLQREETKRFKSKNEAVFDPELKNEMKQITAFQSQPLQRGQICYFMNRYIVSWEVCKFAGSKYSDLTNCTMNLRGEDSSCCCRSFVACKDDMVPELRNMIESDWLYLVKLSKYPPLKNFEQQVIPNNGTMHTMEKTTSCLEYARLSAQKALVSLKSIPLAARRSLPVLVSPKGELLSIPSINFSHCPYLMGKAKFQPRVPLWGGYNSFI